MGTAEQLTAVLVEKVVALLVELVVLAAMAMRVARLTEAKEALAESVAIPKLEAGATAAELMVAAVPAARAVSGGSPTGSVFGSGIDGSDGNAGERGR